MDLTSIVDVLFVNNGITFPIGIILLLAFCSVLMAMQDWRIGVMSFFMGNVVAFIAFYFMGLDMVIITLMLFVSIILMAFSIFATRQGGQLV
jgi:hypothetical protein